MPINDPTIIDPLERTSPENIDNLFDLNQALSGSKAETMDDSAFDLGRAFSDFVPKENLPEEPDKPELTFGRAAGALAEGAKDVARNTMEGFGLLAEETHRDAVEGLTKGTGDPMTDALLDVGDAIGGGKPTKEEAEEMVALSKYVGENLRGAARWEKLKADPEYLQSSGYIEDMLRMGPQMISQIGAGILTGGAGAAALMGAQILGGSYQQYREQGVSHDRALASGLINTIMQTPLEALGIRKTLGLFNIRKSILSKVKDYVTAVGLESATEFLQAYPDAFSEIFATTPDKTNLERLDQMWDGIWDITKQGLYEAVIVAPWAGGGAATAGMRINAKREALRKAGFTDEDFDELNANPLMSPEAILQRNLRDAKEEIDRKAFGTLEEKTKEEKEAVPPEETVEKTETEARKKFGYGLGSGDIYEFEAKQKDSAEEKEALEAQQEAKRQADELHRQVEQKKRAEALQQQEVEARIAALEREQAEADRYSASISTPESLLRSAQDTIPILEESGDPAQRKIAAPIKKAQEALEVGEENPQTLRKIANSLRVYSGPVQDRKLRILSASLQDRLLTQAQALQVEQESMKEDKGIGEPTPTRQTTAGRGVEAEQYQTRTKEALAKAKERAGIKKQIKKAAEVRETLRKEKVPATAQPMRMEEKVGPEIRQKIRPGALEPKPSKAEAEKGRVAAEKGKELTKQEALKAELRAKREAREAKVAEKVREVERGREAYALTPRYERAAGMLKPDTRLATKTLAEFELAAKTKSPAVSEEIEKVIDLRGKDVTQDWLNPAKIGARAIAREVAKGRNFTEAKANVKKWVEDYTLVYNEILSKKFGPKYSKVTTSEAMKEASEEAQESHRRGMEAEINQAKRVLKKDVKFNVLKSVNDLKDSNPELFERIKEEKAFDAAGMWHGGQMYLFSNNISDSYGLRHTAWHELGHLSMQELLGNKSLPLLQRILTDNQKKIDERLDAYGVKHDMINSLTEAEELLIESFGTGQKKYQLQAKSLLRGLAKEFGWQEDIKGKDIDKLMASMKKNLVSGRAKAPRKLRAGAYKNMPKAQRINYDRAWLQFRHNYNDYLGWAKEVLEKAPKAVTWYENYTDDIAFLKDDAPLFNALLAITSPRTNVAGNAIFATESYLWLLGERDKPGGRFPSTIQKMLEKWIDAKTTEPFFEGEEARFKTVEFFRALVGDPWATVNDTWMYRIFFAESDISKDPSDASLAVKEHTAARHIMLRLTKDLTEQTDRKWTPREVQSALWCYKKYTDEGWEIKDENIFDFKDALHKPSRKYKDKTPLQVLKEAVKDLPDSPVTKRYGIKVEMDTISALEKKREAHVKKEFPEKLTAKETYALHFSPQALEIIETTKAKERVRPYSKEVNRRIEAGTDKYPYVPLAAFYTPGTSMEPFVVSGAKAHVIKTTEGKIYDGVNDPLNLWKKAFKTQINEKLDRAAVTNIFAGRVKDLGYEGFTTKDPYGKGETWLMMLKDTPVAIETGEVKIGISDVVQGRDLLPQNVVELKKEMAPRASKIRKQIEARRKKYPEVKVISIDPQMARFATETGNQMEISSMVRVEGALPAIRSMFSEIAEENEQNSVFLLHKNAKEPGATKGQYFFLKMKEGVTEDQIVKELDRKGLPEFNIQVHPDTGSIFVDHFIGPWVSKEDQKKYRAVFNKLKDASFPGNIEGTAYSELVERERYRPSVEAYRGKAKYSRASTFRQWVKDAGGVRPDDPMFRGEFEGIRYQAKAGGRKPTMPVGFFRKQGRGLDDLAASAVAEGFLPEGSDARDLFKAIEENRLLRPDELNWKDISKQEEEYYSQFEEEYKLEEASDLVDELGAWFGEQRAGLPKYSRYGKGLDRFGRRTNYKYGMVDENVFQCPLCGEIAKIGEHKHTKEEYEKFQKRFREKPKYEIRAWHGGRDFEGPFRLEEIGTGEGAQAFGHGLYFTDLKGVAKYYSDGIPVNVKTLEIFGRPMVANGVFSVLDTATPLELSPEERAKWLLTNEIVDHVYDRVSFGSGSLTKYDLADIFEDATTRLLEDAYYQKEEMDNYSGPGTADAVRDVVDEFMENPGKYVKLDVEGRRALYEVTLHKGKSPDDYIWLDWYKPIGTKVVNKINAHWKKMHGEWTPGLLDPEAADEIVGHQLYNMLTRNVTTEWGVSVTHDEAAASMFLLNAGIDGIRYPTQTLSGRPIEHEMSFNYVVFDPRAITIERKIKYSRTRIADQISDPDLREAAEHLGHFTSPAENVHRLQMGRYDRFMTWLADKFYPLRKLAEGKDVDVSMDPYVSKRMLSNMPSILESFLEYGDVKYEDHWINIDTNTRSKGGGIHEIYRALGEDADYFFDWMTALSAEEILDRDAEAVSQGKPSRFGEDRNLFGINRNTGDPWDDREMVKRIKEYTNPIYKNNKARWNLARKRLQEINKMVLDFSEKCGNINGELRKGWERDNYIPFYRLFDDWREADIASMFPKNGPLSTGGIHTLRGSALSVGDPFSNLVESYSFLIHEGLKNLTHKKALELMLQSDLAYKVPHTMKMKDGVLTIRNNGKEYCFKITDPVLFDTLGEVEAVFNGNFSKLLTVPKKMLTYGVTIMPAFRLANFFRDTLHVSLMEKSFAPFFSSMKGFWHAIKNTDYMKEYKATGGAFTGAYHRRDIIGQTEKDVERIKGKLLEKERKLNPLNPYDWMRASVRYGREIYRFWDKVGSAGENAARLGVYMQARKAGASKLEAGFRAKDLLDFHLSGAGSIARAAMQTVPFLNARVQGLYKLGRAAKDKRTRGNFFLRGAILAALSLALRAVNDDDERYNDLPDYDKWSYYHFFDVPGLGHLKLPLPFEIGTIFSALPVVFTESLMGKDDWNNFGKFLWWSVNETFRLDMPQIVKPFYSWGANKNTFTGAPTVPYWMEDLEPHLQRKRNTSDLAVALAKVIKQPAAKVQQFVSDALGSSSAVAFYVGDQFLRWISDHPSDPFEVETRNYILGSERFVKGEKPPRYTKHQEDFYEFKSDVDRACKTIAEYRKLRDRKALQDYLKKHRKTARLRKLTDRVSKRVGRVNQQIDLILMNKTWSAEKKQEKIDRLIDKRNDIFRDAMKIVERRR